MSEKASYFKIGVFVIFAVVLAVGSVVVFGSGVLDPEPIRIETYFDTTVTGLEVGAKFLARGVDFGEVESIEFARTAYSLDPMSDDGLRYGRYIVVVIAMSPANIAVTDPEQQRLQIQRLIAGGLRLRFASQGLTGVAYLDGDFLDPEDYPPFDVPWEPRHPYLPSAPSTFGAIAESIDTVARNLGEVEFQETFDELNGLLADIHVTVDNINNSLSGERLDSILTSIDEGMESFSAAMVSVQEASASLNQEIQSEEFQATLTNIEQTTARLPSGVDELNALLRRLNNYAAGSYGDIDTTLANLRLISDGIRQLTDLAKRYPSQILFGNPPNKTQPGRDRR